MKLAAPRSLLAQFVVLHVAVALTAAVVLLWSATTLLHQTADHFQQTLLRRQAQIVTASLARGERVLPPVLLSDGMAIAVIGANRKIDSLSGPARREILAVAPLDRTMHFFRHGAIEGYSVPIRAGWIVASQDDTDPEVVTDDIVRTFLKRFALVSLPVAALLPLIGVLLARRLTLRMRRVSVIAATIGPRAFDTRLPVALLPLEVAPLAQATNAVLDRLAEALQVQAAFAADVAHELRTPLAVIRLRADAIVEGGVRGQMMAAVDRAARVITQLLALAELEHPLAIEAMPIELADLAAGVVGDRAPAIFAAGRSIALEVHPGVPAVRGYQDAIVLALENLIDNATKYTPPGSAIVIWVGPGAQLGVSDDGVGVPDADLHRLKQRHWRGTATDTEGSGIGLSIVDRVARAHGGALAIDRGPGGEGMIFRITLEDDDR